MNEFEKKINALRLRFKAERISIQKDADRTIGHINTAIGMVNSPEARQALRAERARIFEATRQSMKYNRLCYIQQLELLNEEYLAWLGNNPSNRQIRSLIANLCKSAEAKGRNSISINFGDNRRCELVFS